MCDLVAPILVILDDEAITHSCFSKLMERMLGWVLGTVRTVWKYRTSSIYDILLRIIYTYGKNHYNEAQMINVDGR